MKAAKGDSAAQLALGRMYLHGSGAQRKKGFEWILKSAQTGYVPILFGPGIAMFSMMASERKRQTQRSR